MILTHPILFNTIVIFFIAFTSGWLVYVLAGQRTLRLKNKMGKLEHENEHLRNRAAVMEQQLKEAGRSNHTPVISLTNTTTSRINKTSEAGI